MFHFHRSNKYALHGYNFISFLHYYHNFTIFHPALLVLHACARAKAVWCRLFDVPPPPTWRTEYRAYYITLLCKIWRLSDVALFHFVELLLHYGYSVSKQDITSNLSLHDKITCVCIVSDDATFLRKLSTLKKSADSKFFLILSIY